MNIIIIGCGKIGLALAEQLNNEGHNITLVDKNESILQAAATKLDVMGVGGNGAMVGVLDEAGIESCDVLIATTGSDEVNMLCCLLAKRVRDVETIARIRNPEYEDEIHYLQNEIGISMVINPEQMVAHEILRLLRFPSATEIESFGKGMVDMIHIRLSGNSPLCGIRLKDLSKTIPAPVLISMIERRNEVIIPSGTTELLENDEISFMARPSDAVRFCKLCKLDYAAARNAFVVGGGRISYYLGRYNKNSRTKCQFKVIESNAERANTLAETFSEFTVIQGDGASKQLLIEEGIEHADAFITITGFDEQNIMMGLMADKLSKARVIAKVNRVDPEDVESVVPFASIVSPKAVTADSVVRYVRALESSKDSEFETLYKLAGGRAEAMEFTVNNDPSVVNIPFSRLSLKPNVLIAAIIRGSRIISPGGQDSMKPGDSVVVITTIKGVNDLHDIMQ